MFFDLHTGTSENKEVMPNGLYSGSPQRRQTPRTEGRAPTKIKKDQPQEVTPHRSNESPPLKYRIVY